MTRIRRSQDGQRGVGGGRVMAVTVALAFAASVGFVACSSAPGVTVATSESVAGTDESRVADTVEPTASSEAVTDSVDEPSTVDRSAADSYAAGYADGYADGYNDGYNDGYVAGGGMLSDDLSAGDLRPATADDSYQAGFDAGYDQGWNDGWDDGYDDALADVDVTVAATLPRDTFPRDTFPPDSVAPNLTEYARITTWFTAAAADDSAWVHFKAVNGSGYTVNEALGSDIMNLVDEAGGAAQTAKRVELVDSLRQMMIDDGWTELGVDGEWYEYTFGR